MFEFAGKCCCGGAINCPQWNACLPNRVSVSLSFVFRITERWFALKRGGGEWAFSADATFVRVGSGPSAYMIVESGTYSWNAASERYAFHGDSFGSQPCYPCRSGYLAETRVAVPIIDAPLTNGVFPIGGGVIQTRPFCFQCLGGSNIYSGFRLIGGGPFQWNDTYYRENGSVQGSVAFNSTAPRFVSVVATRPGCMNDIQFKDYAIENFGAPCDGFNGCGLVPGRQPVWWGTGNKNCTNQEKSFGICSDSSGNGTTRPYPDMGHAVEMCPENIFDTHSCFGQNPPLQCGSSFNFPPYNEDGIVPRTFSEEMVSAFQITAIS
jgi:hypothetical protein